MKRRVTIRDLFSHLVTAKLPHNQQAQNSPRLYAQTFCQLVLGCEYWRYSM